MLRQCPQFPTVCKLTLCLAGERLTARVCVQDAMTSSSAAGSEADAVDYLAGLRAVLDPASSETSSGTGAGPYLEPVGPCLTVLASVVRHHSAWVCLRCPVLCPVLWAHGVQIDADSSVILGQNFPLLDRYGCMQSLLGRGPQVKRRVPP